MLIHAWSMAATDHGEGTGGFKGHQRIPFRDDTWRRRAISIGAHKIRSYNVTTLSSSSVPNVAKNGRKTLARSDQGKRL